MRKLYKGIAIFVMVLCVSFFSVGAVKKQKEYTDYRTRTVVKHNTKTNLINKTISVQPNSKYNLDFKLGNKVRYAAFKSSNTKLATVNKNTGQIKFKKKTGTVTIHVKSFEKKNYKVKFKIGNATYVKVSIKKQKAYLYVNGKLRRTAKVVTGKKGVHDTSKGTWYVEYKTRNTHLDGSTVGFSYYLPVKYWIPLKGTGGVGLHDASWRSYGSYGGSYYKTSGSHGCINMRTKDVAYFYKYLKAGSRVSIV